MANGNYVVHYCSRTFLALLRVLLDSAPSGEASHPIHGGNQQGYREGEELRPSDAECCVEGHGRWLEGCGWKLD